MSNCPTLPFTSRSAWIWSSEGCSARPAEPSPSAYEVRRFRRTFSLEGSSGGLTIHITADSRYVLFLNGARLGGGPAAGDVRHHFFDSYEVPASELAAGVQTLAVLVLDYSKIQCDPPQIGAPAAVMTRTGGLAVEVIHGGKLLCCTDKTWKVKGDRTRRFQPGKLDWFGGFVGLFEEFVASEEHGGDWTAPGFDDKDWEVATELYPTGLFENLRDAESPYGLMPRITPLLQPGSPIAPLAVFLPGGGEPPSEWSSCFFDEQPVRIPAHTSQCILIEFDKEWTGFPRVEWQGGDGAEIRIGYAEALRLSFAVEDAVIFGRGMKTDGVSIGFAEKGVGWTFDRRGSFEGFEDIVHPGAAASSWQPVHWRTAKFLRLQIKTGAEPIEFKGLSFSPQHYPLEETGEFRCSDERMERLHEINLHTLRLSMHETFVDCPYYEQLQYIGDSALNCQVAMMAGGAYPAARQLIRHFDWSRVPEGWTQSRYPSRIEGIIPSQSLDWIGAAHAYALHSGDLETLRGIWPGLLTVLNAYERHRGPSGLPQDLPYWNWIDWCPDWHRGVPPGAEAGPVLCHAAKFGIALEQAATMAAWLGETGEAQRLQAVWREVRSAVQRDFWNGEFFAENVVDPRYGSRIGNALGVLAGFVDPGDAPSLAALLAGDGLADCSFFGYFFVRQALWEMGACDFTGQLQPWINMMDLGLTTWAEDTTFWRSLCHGWSSNPAIDIYTRILGVRPQTPGFAETVIEPAVGLFSSASGAVATPHGPVRVAWDEENIVLRIPEGVRARLVLPGRPPTALVPGKNVLALGVDRGAASPGQLASVGLPT